MKINIKLILLLIVSQFGFSQNYYSHYLDETSEWRYHRNNFNIYTGEATDYYTTSYFDGFEIHNGISYYKRYSRELEVTSSGTTQISSQINLYGPALFREDELGKFYYFNIDTNTESCTYENQPVINAQLGDQYPFGSCNVYSVDYYQVGSLSLKRIKGSVSGINAGDLEGVGKIGPRCGLSFEGGEQILNCYTKQGQTIQFDILDCSLFPNAQRQGLNVSEFNSMYIQVYPNPVLSLVNVSTKENIKSIQLIDIQGRILQNKTVNSLSYLLDLSEHQKGTYFLKLITDNGTTTKKIVKE